MERSDWQLRLSTHKERSKYAFDNSLFCDVEFSVGDSDGNKVTVPANKYPLAVCSPVFEAMFYGKLAETKSPIHMPDCTEEGLQEILRYAHYEETNLTGSNVMEVLYLAKKYMMPSLEEQCQHYIQNELGPEDVLSILPHVQKMGDENLEKHAWKIVDTNTEEVISSKSFLNASRKLLYQVLTRNTLKVNELNLFKAVDKWVTKRIEEDKDLVCNGETKRAILGEDIIRLIRFPLMTHKEIVELVLPCQVLVVDELTELFSIFGGIAPKTEIFSPKKRSNAELWISDIRFASEVKCPSNFGWNYQGTKDCVNVFVDKAVDLVGVRLFGSKGNTYNVELKINKDRSRECIANKSSSYATEEQKIDGLYYGFTVTLDKPVRLKPGVVYNIEALIGGPTSWKGDSGNKVVTAGGQITITYTDASGPTNGTSSSKGQFPSLVLQTV